ARIDWSATPRAVAARVSDGSAPVYLEVQQRGIHRVRVADLAAAGQDLATAPTAALALRDATGPVPVRIMGAAGATLGADAVLEFIGEPRHSLYGTANRYSLTVDPASARRPTV